MLVEQKQDRSGAPPEAAVRLLRRYCPGRWMEEVEGDLEELYRQTASQSGRLRAGLAYWKEVLLFCLWHGLKGMKERDLTLNAGMYRNYLTVALRNLRRQKGYAFINITGLAMGMACCILILLLIRHEWSYDAFHEHRDAIYRVVIENVAPGGEVTYRELIPPEMGATMAKEYPAVERYTNVVAGGSVDLRHEDRILKSRVMMGDSAFFSLFTFPLLAGDPRTALAEPNGIVLSVEASRRFFGEAEPGSVLGRTMLLPDGDTTYTFAVTGVAAPIPANSSLRFDALIPFENYPNPYLGGNDSGGRTSLYVQLEESQTPEALEASLQPFTQVQFAERILDERTSGYLAEGPDAFALRLQPLRELHLNPAIDTDYEEAPHNPVYSYVLGGIALLVLLIACINFMILSVGRSATRAKEVGMRKVLGAQRGQVMKQFWGEALLIGVVALVAGIGLAALLLPFFNTLSGRTLSLGEAVSRQSLLALVALIGVVGLVAGGYPAAVLSRFQPVTVLKGNVKARGNSLLMRGLVVVQYTLSVALIASTLVMSEQLSYLLNRDLGFEEDRVVVVHTYSVSHSEAPAVLERFRAEIGSDDRIAGIVRTGYSFTRGGDFNGWTDAENKPRRAACFGVDYDYLEVMGMELAAGRNFSRERPSDPVDGVLVNEALVREFGIENPIGYKLTGWHSWYREEPPTIIGVVRDFNFQSLHRQVEPAVMTMHPDYYMGMNAMLVKVRPEDVTGAVSLIEQTWKETLPGRPFGYSFLDEDVAQQYESERRWGRILTYSSVLAIVIACLGLFGLATLTVARRTKEIGIRKVLGGSVQGITALLSRDFVVLVAISSLLAAPLAYFAMQRWLEGFAYKITMGPGVFLGAAGAALLIALLTVSVQSIRAASADPVRSLRYE